MASAQAELNVPFRSLFRQRLVERVLRATQFRLTMLVAGAGFGKSIAVRDFLQAHPLEHVRFDVKPDNRSLISFVRGFANAISATNPHLRLSLAGALEAAKQSSEPEKALADWLLAHLGSAPTTIVIDDLHYVRFDADVAAVSSLLKMLVDQTRGQKRWIISSRSNMGLPVIAWCESGAMDAPVDENDLRFTAEEARCISTLQNAGLSDDELINLVNVTEGWPAAFMLGLSGSKRFPEIELQAAKKKRAIYPYLARRLFDNAPPHIKRFLLETSVFPSLDDALLEHSHWTDHAKLIAELGGQGGIISSSGNGVPRYPELLRDFLEDELKKNGVEAFTQAMQHAAQALEESGQIADALRYRIEIRDAQHVARLLEAHGFNLIESGSADIVQASVATTESAAEQGAVVCALLGFFEFQRGRFDTSDAWFRLGMSRSSDDSERTEVTYRYCSTLMHRRQTAECIELLESILDFPKLSLERRASSYSTLAIAYVLSQQFTRAHEPMKRALDLLKATDSQAIRAEVYQSAAWTAIFTGDVEGARRAAPMAFTAATEAGLYDVAARALSVLYNIASDIDDDPIASLEVLTQIAECALKSGNVGIRLYALTGAFLIEAERGNTRVATELSQAISYYELNYSDVFTSEGVLSGQALLLAGNGQFAEAYNLLAPSADRQVTPDRQAMRWSEIALYGAAAALISEAEAALRFPNEHLLEESNFSVRGVQIALNVVLALMLIGKKTAASELLSKTAPQVVRHSIRLRCQYGAVSSIFQSWQGAANHNEVSSGLRAMRANSLGGLALVYESFPMNPQGQQDANDS